MLGEVGPAHGVGGRGVGERTTKLQQLPATASRPAGGFSPDVGPSGQCLPAMSSSACLPDSPVLQLRYTRTRTRTGAGPPSSPDPRPAPARL